MRTLVVSSFFSLLAGSVSAATLQVEVSRNGFTEPIEIAVASRAEGKFPDWLVTRTLAAGKSAIAFPGLDEGLYTVLAKGSSPLQRLGRKANVGKNGNLLRLVIPKSRLRLQVMLAGRPLPAARMSLNHDELLWETRIQTGEDGRFEGALWQPGVYVGRIWPERTVAPHIVEITLVPTLSREPLNIEVPDRHITGRVLGDDGKPLAGALVLLRTESTQTTLAVQTNSAADGTFEFFGAREGGHTLSARMPSYLYSDADTFELRGSPARHVSDLKLTRGAKRAVRVVDEHGRAIARTTLFAACEGHVKSTAVTNAVGRTDVALPGSRGCVIYAVPEEGSIAVARVDSPDNLFIRVPPGSSSLRLALKSQAGENFSDLRLLMRVDGAVIPPAVARQLGGKGFSLTTDGEGIISLAHIPAGTYEFWPYRTEAEGEMLYDIAADFAAPISVNVLTGENNATVRFKAR